MADEITPVRVGWLRWLGLGKVVGWVEYHPDGDTYRARLRGDAAGQTFHDLDAAVEWVREQHADQT